MKSSIPCHRLPCVKRLTLNIQLSNPKGFNFRNFSFTFFISLDINLGGLTDETFSVLCGIEPAADVSRPWYMFWVTLLDQFYWVAGSAVGSLLGSVLSFNTKGLDFVLTALFVVIFVGQWQETDNHIPAVIGVVVTLLCRIFFGTGSFLIPAMIGILICLSLAEKQRREVG